MSNEQICTECYHVGKGKTPGSFLIELVLWCFMIVPGLIYTIWRNGKKGKMCPECRSISMISASTPRGKKLLVEIDG